MAWPCRRELWGDELDRAKQEYAQVAQAIAGPGGEPVLMVAAPGQAGDVRARCGTDGIEVLEAPIDDSWLRDSGPIFVSDGAGRRAGVHFRFNAWGEKFSPWNNDAEIGRVLLQHLGVERIDGAMVLEGGSVTLDGSGTLVTTEQCLLNPNRNPDLTRSEIERRLGATLGAPKVVWLVHGLSEDLDTDGHVDLLAAFTAPGELLLCLPTDSACPDTELMAANRERLLAAGLRVIELPYLPHAEVAGEVVCVSYMNYYIANQAVVVPVSGADSDADALTIIERCYPGRDVIGVPATVLAYGGGGPHCITQQMPAA